MWNTVGWLSLLCLLTLFGTLFINYQAATGIITNLPVGEVSDKYELPITPASWTFSIWAFIYTWQVIWIIYLLIFSCKYSDKLNNTLLTPYFYISYIISNILNAVWIIVWCNEKLVGAAILLILLTICLIFCAYISHLYILIKIPLFSAIDNEINDETTGLKNDNNNTINKEFFQYLKDNIIIQRLFRMFILNGIPFYATWTTIASHLNFGIMLSYKANLDVNTSSIVMTSILTCFILFYWFLDFYYLRNYLKYTFSPYITLIVAFSGVISNDYDFEAPKIFVVILLAAGIIMSIAKIIMGCILYRNDSKLQSV